MRNKKSVAKLILSIAILLLLCISTFSTFSNDKTFNVIKILSNFMFNLPIFLLIGYVDYTIITYRQNKNQHYGIGVSLLVDFATTVVFIIILETLVAGICFLLQLKEFYFLEHLLASILLNCMVVSCIEISCTIKGKLKMRLSWVLQKKKKRYISLKH